MSKKQDNNNRIQVTMISHHQEQQPQPAMPQHAQYNGDENNSDHRQDEEQPVRDCDACIDDDYASDASSLGSLFGSIRPDPNYDPAKDPMNPLNAHKQFVPPREIIIKTVRGRRRKTMGRVGDVRCEEDRSRSLSPMRTPAAASNTTPPTTPTLRRNHQYCQQQQQKRPNYPPSLMMPALNHPLSSKKSEITESTIDIMASEMFVSDDVFHNDRIPSVNSIVIDDDDLESDKDNDTNNDNENDDDNKVVVGLQDQEQQFQQKERKGMVRREFGRRILALKKKAKTYSLLQLADSNHDRNNDEIDGNDIDRVFPTINEINASTTSGSSTNSSTNNDSEMSNIAINKAKSTWHANLFATKSIFAKQDQEKRILESSMVC
jgi:hypothetical protein